MSFSAKSIRAFIGAKNYKESRSFYKDLGFQEVEISNNMCLFRVNDTMSFYLQDAYVKDWVDNSMLFLEVDDVTSCFAKLQDLKLEQKYQRVRLSPIKTWDWGRECFLHDPSGILWHFGQFNPKT